MATPGQVGTRYSKVLKSILLLQLKRKGIPTPAVNFAADPAIGRREELRGRS
jgi:hypothetical protein